MFSNLNQFLSLLILQVSKSGYEGQTQAITVVDSVDPQDVAILNFDLLSSGSTLATPSGLLVAILWAVCKMWFF